MDIDEGLRVIAELRNRQEIHDCVQRFCRGIDRNDKELALSAYHPDAVDFHTYAGAPVFAVATEHFNPAERDTDFAELLQRLANFEGRRAFFNPQAEASFPEPPVGRVEVDRGELRRVLRGSLL